MNNEQTTFTDAQLGGKMSELNIDDLKAMAIKTVVNPQPKGYSKGWFERLMNRVGWYRSSEWYLIDSSKFMRWPTFIEPKIKE